MAGLHLQRIYTALGRDRDAVDVALRLSRLHPDDPEVLYHSGRLFANFAYLQTMRLAAVAPESVWLHQAAGEANESQGLYDAALSEYRQVLAAGAAPSRHPVSASAASCSHARTAIPPARMPRGRAAGVRTGAGAWIPPTRTPPMSSRRWSARPASWNPRASCSSRRVKHYPAFEQALVGLGRTLIALGRPADALPHLQAAARKPNPDNDVAYYQLAQAYRALGNTAAQEARSRTSLGCAPRPPRGNGDPPCRTSRDVTPQALDAHDPPMSPRGSHAVNRR